MAEYSLGRITRRGPFRALEVAGLAGGKGWGGLLLVTAMMAGSYYGVIVSWVIYFAVAYTAQSLGWSWPAPDFGRIEN